MAFVLADFVCETTTTTGTGTLSLAGAVSGFRSFVAGIGDGNTTHYSIIGSDGSWETGTGTVTDGSPDTLARTSISASSNSGSAINLPAGTHTVICGPIASLGALAYTAIQPGAIGSTVQGYDADTAKLDVAQSWTAVQSLSAGCAGGTDTVASAGSSQTITLNGKTKLITLDAATCTLTPSATGSAYSAALVILIQDATGGRAVNWASSPKVLGTQSLNTTASKHSAWLLWTPNGGTTYYLSDAGVEA